MMAELEMLEKYFGTMPQAFSLLEVLVNEREEPYDFRFIYLNEAAAKLNCMSRRSLFGSRFYQVYPQGDKKWLAFLYDAAFRHRPHILRKFYSPEINKYLKIIYYPWTGNHICASIMTDETELVEADHRIYTANSQLQAAKDAVEAARKKAEQANAAKTSFLSHVSHDMRTPLNGIIGYTELAMQAGNEEKMREYLAKIQSSGKLLLELINNTLDISRIESGAITLNPQTASGREVLQGIITAVQGSMEQRHIDFVVDDSLALMTDIQVDVLRLREIFINLLSNALKFTPEGGRIDFKVETLQLDENQIHNKFIVQDNGCGISGEFLPRIFEPFAQEQKKETANIVGTGLGLAIVKQLVELMGGSISVESQLGQGTAFTVLLDFNIVVDYEPAEAVEAVSLDILQGKKVLLCEDNPINTEIAVLILEKQGIQVVAAENGREGTQFFMDSDIGEFAAVLMDEQMPVMDGFQAASAIRHLTRPDAGGIPIVALTGNAYEEDVQRSLEAGMDAHLLKPFDPEQLCETLARLIRQRSRG